MHSDPLRSPESRGVDGETSPALAPPRERSSSVGLRGNALLGTVTPSLWRVAGLYERNHERRQELHQEMLVAFWRSWSSASEKYTAMSWANHVGHRVGVDHRARERRRRTMEHAARFDEIETVDRTADQEAAVAVRQCVDRLGSAMIGLPPLDRQLMELRLEGHGAPEIIHLTGRSPGVVSSRLERVTRALQVKLAKEGYATG